MSEKTLPLVETVEVSSATTERVVPTRHGKPAAVENQSRRSCIAREILDILSDPDALREIREREADVAAGRFTSGDELTA